MPNSRWFPGGPRLALAALLAASAAACAGSPVTGPGDERPMQGDPRNVPAGAQALTLSTPDEFARALEPFRFYSGLEERRRMLVRDRATWAALWAQVTEGVSPRPPLPEVDFSQHMIVLAAMGMRPSGGFMITIDAVHEASGSLYVTVTETAPGPQCGTTAAITNPLTAVLAPQRAGAVAFIERTATHTC